MILSVDVVAFALVALAVFRATQLVVYDDGPFDIFLRWRVFAGVYDRDESGRVVSGMGRLFECPFCVGLWLALVGALAIAPPWPVDALARTVLVWLALAGAQAALETLAGRAEREP